MMVIFAICSRFSLQDQILKTMQLKKSLQSFPLTIGTRLTERDICALLDSDFPLYSILYHADMVSIFIDSNCILICLSLGFS